MTHLNRLLSRQLQLATHHHRTPSRHFAKRSPKLPELEAAHIPVMKDEVLRLWAGDDGSNKHLIDGTIGLGGHSLAAIEAGSKVLGIDRDSYILRAVKRRLDAALATHDNDADGESDATYEAAQQQEEEEPHDKPYALHHGSYADLSSELLQSHSFPPTVDGILLDLGANTYQLENAVRGFTFRRQGPLDMRFDAPFADHTGTRRKAYDIVNTYTVEELANLFDRHADEPYAMPIARAIVRWRTEKNFERSKKDKKHSRKSKGIVSTLELRYIIEAAIASHRNTIQRPAVLEHKKRPEDKHYRYRKIWRHHDQGAMTKNKRIKKLLKMYEEDKVRKADHVARCFQALRIETNDELRHLDSFLSNLDTTNTLENLLNAGGRLVAIAFQPGEDGLVRSGMEAMVRSGKFRWITPEEEGMRPSEEEVKVNGKSRTARLRAVEKIK